MLPESAGIKNPDRRPAGKLEEIPVPRDQNISLASNGGCKHPRVVGISHGDVHGLLRTRDDNLIPEEVLDRIHRFARNPEAQSENSPHLREIHLTRKEHVLRQHMAKHVCTQTTGRECAHQHIRVKEDPHETSDATSSSVR